jgi:hypothetical protein
VVPKLWPKNLKKDVGLCSFVRLLPEIQKRGKTWSGKAENWHPRVIWGADHESEVGLAIAIVIENCNCKIVKILQLYKFVPKMVFCHP